MSEKLTRVALLRATRAGIEAARAGEPLTACPYKPGGDLAQRFLTKAWLSGYHLGVEATGPEPA